jgi:glycolate oxidase FAD binding subunit
LSLNAVRVRAPWEPETEPAHGCPRSVRRALTQLREAVHDAQATGTAVRLRGGGTKDFYGGVLQGEVLDVRGLTGVVAYYPGDGLITVRAGTPLAELEALLRTHGQCLASEPPHFGPGATVGGMVASGLSGPRRGAAGPLCDHVLGAAVMNGRGETVRFGSAVLRSVAGYDLPRLWTGSLGILGPLTEVSLSVVSLPQTQVTLELTRAWPDAWAHLRDAADSAWPVSASMWCDGTLRWRCEGTDRVVAAAQAHWVARHGARLVEPQEALAFWQGLREHTHPFFAGDRPVWRLAVPAHAPAFEFLGSMLMEWGGALRWVRSEADPEVVRRAAATVGGHATWFRGAPCRSEVFAPVSAPVRALHKRLKEAWDPQRIFNRDRLIAGL